MTQKKLRLLPNYEETKLMHPNEFIRSKIAKGETGDVIKLIDEFSEKLRRLKTPEHACVYNFVNKFMLSVEGQLRLHHSNETFDNDKFLSVWSALGFFGIDRDKIPPS